MWPGGGDSIQGYMEISLDEIGVLDYLDSLRWFGVVWAL